MEANGQEVPRDAFGHIALAKINPGQYSSTCLSTIVGAEKTLVQSQTTLPVQLLPSTLTVNRLEPVQRRELSWPLLVSADAWDI